MSKPSTKINISEDLLKRIIDVQKTYRRIGEDLFKSIDNIQSSIKWMEEPLREANRAIAATLALVDFRKLREAARILADEGLKVRALQEAGWWYCPSMADIDPGDIKTAALKHKRGNRVALTNLFKRAYHQNNYSLLKLTVKSWKANPLFGKRFKVIEDALGAHIEGKYTTSIPALLPLAEGVATEFCRKERVPIKTRERSSGGLKIEKAFEKLMETDYPFKFPNLFLDLIQNNIYAHSGKAAGPFRRRLNRHGILHGSYVKYYDPTTSLRCFLLLDAVSALKMNYPLRGRS